MGNRPSLISTGQKVTPAAWSGVGWTMAGPVALPAQTGVGWSLRLDVHQMAPPAAATTTVARMANGAAQRRRLAAAGADSTRTSGSDGSSGAAALCASSHRLPMRSGSVPHSSAHCCACSRVGCALPASHRLMVAFDAYIWVASSCMLRAVWSRPRRISSIKARRRGGTSGGSSAIGPGFLRRGGVRSISPRIGNVSGCPRTACANPMKRYQEHKTPSLVVIAG